jgi:hypothetical protein
VVGVEKAGNGAVTDRHMMMKKSVHSFSDLSNGSFTVYFILPFARGPEQYNTLNLNLRFSE